MMSDASFFFFFAFFTVLYSVFGSPWFLAS